ncbi:cysteine synthase 2-like isoform X1 [Hibiscus syriacus]|uniref:Cysteine synthase 2-like isoform X1 n=1 Tax=Hibiscus syriacus TaxID=106335 RepID=A0A6A2ZHA8_HIBSY|nr:uncharacterized protein LOC120144486 [Hibiscus syriacus]KAE8691384.1 cysteine synthase 2-like isoform X1 [Hibiscus syriacus]
MDSSPVHTTSSPHEQEEWAILALFLWLFIWKILTKKGENIYLGPHGAPPSQSRQQELNLSSRKQRFKQKLKEADRRIGGAGQENKVENLKELVCGGKTSPNMSKGSPGDWLDPHCDESQFEKSYPQ